MTSFIVVSFLRVDWLCIGLGCGCTFVGLMLGLFDWGWNPMAFPDNCW